MDYIPPVFHYAITTELSKHLPCLLDGKELTERDFLPSQQNASDAGWDVRCAENNTITLNDGSVVKGYELTPHCYFKMKLGFRMFAPPGWWLKLAPRSSTFTKLHINALYGVIDTGYSGEFLFSGVYIPDACTLISSQKIYIPFGARVAQVIPQRHYTQQVEMVSNEELEKMYSDRNETRGLGQGFGSSGVV